MVVTIEVTVTAFLLWDAQSILTPPLLSIQTTQIIIHFKDRVVAAADVIVVIVGIQVDHVVIVVAAADADAAVGRQDRLYGRNQKCFSVIQDVDFT